MTVEIVEAAKIKTNIMSADYTVSLHSLELLLDVTLNILAEGTSKEKIVSTIRCEINEAKRNSRA